LGYLDSFVETHTINPEYSPSSACSALSLLTTFSFFIIVACKWTFAMPYICKPLDRGADLTIQSLTRKYYDGLNIGVGGALVSSTKELLYERTKLMHHQTSLDVVRKSRCCRIYHYGLCRHDTCEHAPRGSIDCWDIGWIYSNFGGPGRCR
jgi:hypothetical protein